MRLAAAAESAQVALEQLRANKLRSTLTILGVVIGVATVMGMASIVQGIREQILNAVEAAGPTTFYVMRFFSPTPLNPDALPKAVRIRPVLTHEEAEAIARLPDIEYAGIWVQVYERMEYENVQTQLLTVFGADEHYMDVQGGSLVAGRFFTAPEVRGGDAVVVLEQKFAAKLFGRMEPIGRSVRVAGKPWEVVGVYARPENIFQPPSQEIGAIVPFAAARRFFRYDETNALWIIVKPRPNVRVSRAMDEVAVLLRHLRGTKTGDPSSFDMITQDQILNVFNQLTGVFFLVMLVLSSVALLVGGIGVMAIMTVSVTDRTAEIGVRKAMGATRADILWQFLFEASALTLIGGALGVVAGIAMAEGIHLAFRFDTRVPAWSAGVACLTSLLIGLVFGITPAARAARLDPVDALRYE
ncbi:MAG TPA: ABC transporter permease [Gemmatimonadales bacterium]|nr:ABC transporter permease [Gemmatimonadales bacterium]